MNECSNGDCEETFGYDAAMSDPPEGEGHIEAVFNSEDGPSYLVNETRYYCSVACLQADADNHPFGGDE